MKLFRLTKNKHSRDLSGKGAELSGGRWNSKGTPMLYTSTSIALATTEVAVHVPLGILPKGYVVITFEIPDDLEITVLQKDKLSPDWRSIPHANSTQIIGDNFILEGRTPALRVPSAVVQGEYNLLLNPLHPLMQKITIISIEGYDFDERLFKHLPDQASNTK